MSTLKEITAIVRRDSVASLVRALEKRGVTRLFVSHVHAIGAGVDPEHFRLSMEEGETFSEKAKIEFVCKREDVDELLNAIRHESGTGHRGDGVITVADVNRIVNIRTGAEDYLALL